ncbi:MAG: transcription antitermination factor NusB [bacterium]|nr:transcription antitermination factor NusB [bacterium]
MGSRRQSREITIQYLYACDIQKEFAIPTKSLLNWIAFPFHPDSRHLSDESLAFAEHLITGIIKTLNNIDECIKKYADNWEIFRIAYIDRNILRMAIYEILFLKDIPPVVSIDEAVDIAKKYSTPDSGKFVNGILDKIQKNQVV